MDEITQREKQLLQYIIKFKQVNGYSPTIREIQKGIYNGSFQHVSEMLLDLRDKGYITFKNNSPRTIVVRKFV